MDREPPRKPTSARGFDSPVRWLLGDELLASMKGIALYAAYGDKLDHKDWMTPRVHTAEELGLDPKGEEVWLDYLADSGDAQMAVYNVAYLALGDLWAERGQVGAAVTFEPPSGADAVHLPRGSVLVVGGDTAYHVADYATLARRFWAPFCWASEERRQHAALRLKEAVEAQAGVAEAREAEARVKRDVPFFGIPGNHDYYDSLHGYNRQFRRPVHAAWLDLPHPLHIPGLERFQEASYFALHLPGDWWFWGVDSQEGRSDLRQRHFFTTDASPGGQPPHKLIVATPEPALVKGRKLHKGRKLRKGKKRHGGDALLHTFEHLGLERRDVTADPPRAPNVPAPRIQLDLSGDTHHYERYFGPPSRSSPTSRAKGRPGDAERYASVVSGGGGAFAHPTYTDFGEIAPQVLYPPAATSRAEVMKKLFNPLRIADGGGVWVAGALVAVIVTFALTLPESTRGILPALGWPAPGVAPGPWPAGLAAEEGASWLTLLLLVPYLPALIALLLPFPRDHEKTEDAFQTNKGTLETARARVAAALALAFLPPPVLLVARRFGVFAAPPAPLFGKDALVIAGWMFLLLCVAWASRYGTELAEKAKHFQLGRFERGYAWGAVLVGLETVVAAHWAYGDNPVALVAADALFLVVLLFAVLGLPALAGVLGAAGLPPGRRAAAALLGLLQGILDAALPALVVLYAPPWTAAAAAAFGLAAWAIARFAAVRDHARVVALTWLAAGAGALAVVFRFAEARALSGGAYLLALLSAAILGAFLSCLWFGWYLAAISLLGGHNNEAGGAARLARFHQILRFKLTPTSLTCYVIAVEEPQVDAHAAKLKLVDVFVLGGPGTIPSASAANREAPP